MHKQSNDMCPGNDQIPKGKNANSQVTIPVEMPCMTFWEKIFKESDSMCEMTTLSKEQLGAVLQGLKNQCSGSESVLKLLDDLADHTFNPGASSAGDAWKADKNKKGLTVGSLDSFHARCKGDG